MKAIPIINNFKKIDIFRGFFKTFSNIYDGAVRENSGKKLLFIFPKNFIIDF